MLWVGILDESLDHPRPTSGRVVQLLKLLRIFMYED